MGHQFLGSSPCGVRFSCLLLFCHWFFRCCSWHERKSTRPRTSGLVEHVRQFFLFQSTILTYFSSGRYFRLAELMANHPSRHPTKPWRLSEPHVRDERCNISTCTQAPCFISYNIPPILVWNCTLLTVIACLWASWNTRARFSCLPTSKKFPFEIGTPWWAGMILRKTSHIVVPWKIFKILYLMVISLKWTSHIVIP